VVFDEGQVWNWNANKVEQLQVDFDGDNDFNEGRKQPTMQVQSEQQAIEPTN